MEFKQLESFVAVVNHKSFTKAAKALYISQPTISSHIQSLEEELKSQLIVRTTKSLDVTMRGQELYDCASQMLGLRDNLLKSWDTETKKVINLGVSTIPSAYIVPEILPEFGKLFPDVYFNVHQSDSQGIIDAMAGGKYDIGMIGTSCDTKTLTSQPFYHDRMVLIAPVNDFFLKLKEAPQIDAELLKNQPIIMREDGSGTLKRADFILDKLGLKADELNIVAKINDQESIKNLTASGLGVSFISAKAAENFIVAKRLLSFELPESLATRTFYIVKHKNITSKPYVEQFAEFATHYY